MSTPPVTSYSIARACAAAVAASESIASAFDTRFGRPLRVCMTHEGTIKPEELDESLCPYIVFNPSEEGGGPEQTRRTYEVAALLVIDAYQRPAGTGWRDATKPTQAADGVWEVADSALLDLSSQIETLCLGTDAGANPVESRLILDGFTAFPLQWGVLTITYQHTQTW